MDNENFMSTEQFCAVYQVDAGFVHALEEYGLLQTSQSAESTLISTENLKDLEQFVHLHYELEINVPGIDAISHLLDKVRDLQRENAMLKARLDRYE